MFIRKYSSKLLCSLSMFKVLTLLITFELFLLGQCQDDASTKLVHVQTFHGEIGASNFTYYKLTLNGHVVVCLNSYVGDADLYLSTETLKPTWEDYTMKSDTCLEDTVIVHSFYQRPVGIGVYGYINNEISKFQLSVYIDEGKANYYPEAEDQGKSTTDFKLFGSKTQEFFNDQRTLPQDEEESLLWNFFVGFLKFLFDILVNVA